MWTGSLALGEVTYATEVLFVSRYGRRLGQAWEDMVMLFLVCFVGVGLKGLRGVIVRRSVGILISRDKAGI